MSDQRSRRDPRNAPGPFYALEKVCLACGLPEDEAPDLLAKLDETGGDTFFVKQPTTPREVERACTAIDICCVKALRYAGDDPAIIQQLQKWSAECCDATDGKPVPLPEDPLMNRTRAAAWLSLVRRLLGRG
jgi:hypothetical protein